MQIEKDIEKNHEEIEILTSKMTEIALGQVEAEEGSMASLQGRISELQEKQAILKEFKAICEKRFKMTDCDMCDSCQSCESCTKCTNCTGCKNCLDCKDCSNCINCHSCQKCHELSNAAFCVSLNRKHEGYWVLNKQVSEEDFNAILKLMS